MNKTKMECTAPASAATVGLPSLYDQGALTDLVIQVGESSYQVHKIIMAAVSKYFKARFTGAHDMTAENGKATEVIDGMSPAVMEILLQFIYKKTLGINKENVQEVMMGAMFLQMDAAVSACVEFIIRRVDVDNWFDILSLLKRYNLQDAAHKVKAFVGSNIWHIGKTFDNSSLDHQDMQFFANNWLRSEPDLFRFIMNWVNADFDMRKEHLEDLMSRVRFGLMRPDQLVSIKEMKIFSDAPNTWCQLVRQAYEYHKLRLRSRVMITSEQTTVRSPPTVVRFVWPMRVESEGSFIELHEQGGRFMQHKDLKCPDTSGGEYLAEIVVNNFLIVCRNVGGKELWHIFDPRFMLWARMGNAPRKFQSASLVHDEKYMYVVGGVKEYGRNPIVLSIERFDFETNQWDTFSSLPCKIKHFGASIIGQSLYISGGQKHTNSTELPVGTLWHPDNSDEEEYNERLKDKPQKKMHRLDLTNGVWETKKAMSEPRCRHTMQTMKIQNEEVCCIFDAAFNLDYYSPSSNQWSRCTFTFTGRAPVKKSKHCYFRGNSCILVDANVRHVYSEEYNVCATIRFPESGLEASVEYLKEYVGRRTWCMMGGHTALAISPATYQDQGKMSPPRPKKDVPFALVKSK